MEELFAIPTDDPDPESDPIRKFLETEVDRAFLARYGAHAAGISRRRKRGHPRGELCLVLYVEPGVKRGQKGSENDIQSPIQWRDPGTGQVVTIPTDIVEAEVGRLDMQVAKPSAGFAKSAAPLQVPGGVACQIRKSAAVPANTSTLGGWVWDRKDNSIVLLSSQHSLGDDLTAGIFHRALVAASKGMSNDRIGRVKRVAMTFDGKPSIDCAIGSIDTPSRILPRVLKIGPAVMAVGTIKDDAEVEKTGHGTGHTLGRIETTAWRGHLRNLNGDLIWFEDCIAIASATEDKWSASGDSGALVFSTTPIPGGGRIKPVVALHMGSSRFEGQLVGVACRIHWVFKALELATLSAGMFATMIAESLVDNGSAVADGSLTDSVNVSSQSSSDSIGQQTAVHPGTVATVILAFRARLNETRLGQQIVKLFTRHRAEIVELLLQDAEIRLAGVRVLRVMFGGSNTVEEVLDRPVVKTTEAVHHFSARIKPKSSKSLMKSIDRCLVEMDNLASGLTVREIL